MLGSVMMNINQSINFIYKTMFIQKERFCLSYEQLST